MVLRHTFLLWIVTLCLFTTAMIFFPHEEGSLGTYAIIAVQLLLFFQSLRLVRNEPITKNKPIFVNFALYFSLSLFYMVQLFIGPGNSLLTTHRYAQFILSEYVVHGMAFVFLALAIVYLTIDLLFRDFKLWQKYAIALLIVGGAFSYYYRPMLTDPIFTYHTPEIADWKAMDKAAMAFEQEQGRMPTTEELAARVHLCSWSGRVATGSLYPEAQLRRVQELYPYLEGMNYNILLMRPLYMNRIYLCVLCVGFILLFFGYQYMKDPPQGAYIERIMFLLLLVCTLEILHAWSYVKSVEWGSTASVMEVGHYVSITVSLLISMFFALRLRFIMSVRGEFYEQELAASPAAVVRWRDAVDNLVIRSFFDAHWLPWRVLAVPRSEAGDMNDQSGSSQ